MKAACALSLVLLAVAGCDKAPTGADTPATSAEPTTASPKDELAKQKLSIEQAAEEATKLIEADAKAEIDAAKPADAAAAQ